MANKGNFKRKTESFLIAAQNNAIWTNHIRARIYKVQQNSKCRLCDDKDETINQIISECSKLEQKEYKTRKTGWGVVDLLCSLQPFLCSTTPDILIESIDLFNVYIDKHHVNGLQLVDHFAFNVIKSLDFS